MDYIKGPWQVQILPDEDSCMDKNVFSVHESHAEDILGICTLNNYKKTESVLEATSYLIAAAPDLLEALEKFKDVFVTFDGCFKMEGLPAQMAIGNAIELAMKAIAKAKNEEV